jgi:hypothetical protein
MLFSLSQSLSNTAKQVPYSLITYIVLICITFAMFSKILQFTVPMLPLAASKLASSQAVLATQDASSGWHPPAGTDINDHARAMDGTGPMAKKVVPWTGAGASEQPQGWQYGEYNYCNMAHVRAEEYVKKGEEFELVFVEVIQRREWLALRFWHLRSSRAFQLHGALHTDTLLQITNERPTPPTRSPSRITHGTAMMLNSINSVDQTLQTGAQQRASGTSSTTTPFPPRHPTK